MHSSRLLPFLLASAAFAHAATIVVDPADITASYNPLNKLPSTAPGSSSTVAGFTSAVSAAFVTGNGAVWGFNSTNANLTSAAAVDVWSLALATGKTLTVGQSIRMRYNNFGSAGATSSSPSASDVFCGFNGESAFTLSFSLSGASVASDEKITQIGFAVINRSTGTTPVYTVTATFDDNSTTVLTDTVTVGTADTDNTHFGIVASAGRYITSLTVSATNSQAAIIDDLGFITSSVIPEPASCAGLASLAALGFAATRRRRRHA